MWILKANFLKLSLPFSPFNLVGFLIGIQILFLCVCLKGIVTVHAHIVVSRITLLLINYIAPFCQQWKIPDSETARQ